MVRNPKTKWQKGFANFVADLSLVELIERLVYTAICQYDSKIDNWKYDYTINELSQRLGKAKLIERPIQKI